MRYHSEFAVIFSNIRKKPSAWEGFFIGGIRPAEEIASAYFGGGGVKISRLLGSGFGLGFGAFFVSLRPLSLFPIADSVP